MIDTVVQTPFFDGSDFVILSALNCRRPVRRHPAHRRRGRRDHRPERRAHVPRQSGLQPYQRLQPRSRRRLFFLRRFQLQLSVNRIMRGNIADLVSGTIDADLHPALRHRRPNNGAGRQTASHLEHGGQPGDQQDRLDRRRRSTGDFEGGWEVRTMNYDGTGNTVVAIIDTEKPAKTAMGIHSASPGVADYALHQSSNILYVVGSLGSRRRARQWHRGPEPHHAHQPEQRRRDHDHQHGRGRSADEHRRRPLR